MSTEKGCGWQSIKLDRALATMAKLVSVFWASFNNFNYHCCWESTSWRDTTWRRRHRPSAITQAWWNKVSANKAKNVKRQQQPTRECAKLMVRMFHRAFFSEYLPVYRHNHALNSTKTQKIIKCFAQMARHGREMRPIGIGRTVNYRGCGY